MTSPPRSLCWQPRHARHCCLWAPLVPEGASTLTNARACSRCPGTIKSGLLYSSVHTPHMQTSLQPPLPLLEHMITFCFFGSGYKWVALCSPATARAVPQGQGLWGRNLFSLPRQQLFPILQTSSSDSFWEPLCSFLYSVWSG